MDIQDTGDDITLGFDIVPLTASHLQDIMPLLCQLGYPSTQEQIKKRVRNIQSLPYNYLICAVAKTGQAVGLLYFQVETAFESDYPIGRISTLVVHEDFRHQGVGKALLREAEKLAQENQCGIIVVNAGNRRKEAHQFYEHCDFPERGKYFCKILKHL